MKIRRADKNDIDDMIRLRKAQLIDEGLSPVGIIDEECRRFFNDMFDQERIVEFLVEDENQIIATAAVVFYDFPPTYSNTTGRKGYVTNMYTHPDYRHQGIATKLLGLIDQTALEHGITHLWLGASKMGEPVYRHCGYDTTNVWLDKKL